jgi:hypothetical protein
MADATLLLFVEESLRSGASREDTERVLKEAGWPKNQVTSALSAYSSVDFPIPVPKPKSQLSARDAFMYLVMFGMLYVTAYNFGNLLFQFINLAFPDQLMEHYRDSAGSQIRWATSSLLVAFPVFLFVASRISKSIASDPSQRTSGVRKWLTYLTLSFAACVIVSDLIYLLNSLLSGALTMRFVLKSLTVGLIAGAVFGYYLWSMRADDEALNQ